MGILPRMSLRRHQQKPVWHGSSIRMNCVQNKPQTKFDRPLSVILQVAARYCLRILSRRPSIILHFAAALQRACNAAASVEQAIEQNVCAQSDQHETLPSTSLSFGLCWKSVRGSTAS